MPSLGSRSAFTSPSSSRLCHGNHPTQHWPLSMPSQSQFPAATGNSFYLVLLWQRREMGVQGPKENQALEIAISVMTLSREQTVQRFYLSEAFLPQIVLFLQNLCLPGSPNITTTLPANSPTGFQQNHPASSVPSCRNSSFPFRGESWTWPGWGNEREQATWRRKRGSHVYRASLIQ